MTGPGVSGKLKVSRDSRRKEPRTMPDFPKLPIVTPPKNSFPELPIVTPDPPRMSLQEKDGGLYYLGVAGLAVAITMVGIFGYDVWALRDVWSSVYLVHHDGRS